MARSPAPCFALSGALPDVLLGVSPLPAKIPEHDADPDRLCVGGIRFARRPLPSIHSRYLHSIHQGD
ncbi:MULTISPECIES: hypothetical protein [Crateriforma]|uniref:hypothetical protein n=1 Tax=Crateriforma TaxID=2714592 RepID=UPI0011B5F958|nr:MULTISPECIES: hypothetical protein [Crateriforma]